MTQRVATLIKSLPKDVKTVYLMNQDYLYGQGVEQDTKRFLADDRPDVKIVGSEFVPLGKVKDFRPTFRRSNSSGAQALITSNWGPDFNLLMKAAMRSPLMSSTTPFLPPQRWPNIDGRWRRQPHRLRGGGS